MTALRLDRQAIRFQERAIWHDRLQRLGIWVSAFFPVRRRPLAISHAMPVRAKPSPTTRRFCTYFDLQYAAAGLAMLQSLQRHCSGSEVTVLCIDEALAPIRDLSLLTALLDLQPYLTPDAPPVMI